jgi:hypothetical protein
MKHMLWSNSVRLWKGDNKTKLFPFNFHERNQERGEVLKIDYKLSKKLSSGEYVGVSNDSYMVNINESFQNGVLKYPKDDSVPVLSKAEELVLFIFMKFKGI